jgi:ATP-dependent Lon protease
MTGELSLQGQVLPIGGLKQKVLAAHRAGLSAVIFPKLNEADLEDVPEDVRNDMTFHQAETIEQVLQQALSEELPLEDTLVEVADPAPIAEIPMN